MKSFEIEQMWIRREIKQGIEQGRKVESVNTLREKERADRLERELRMLRRERKNPEFFRGVPGLWPGGSFFVRLSELGGFLSSFCGSFEFIFSVVWIIIITKPMIAIRDPGDFWDGLFLRVISDGCRDGFILLIRR